MKATWSGALLAQSDVWYHPDPKPTAKQIKDRVAFWHGVEVTP